MESVGRFDLREFFDFVERGAELPATGHSAQDLESVRQLSKRYREEALFQTSKRAAQKKKAQDSIEFIRALAGQFRSVEQKFRKTQITNIRGIDDARIAFFRLNTDAEILAWDEKKIIFKAPELAKLPKLPLGYAFKGGASRLALAALLGKHVKNRVPRDFDIFRVGDTPFEGDVEIAKKYMPDDFAFGNGIELVPDLNSYLDTRDLTINQVALIDGQLICSYHALEDTLNAILRPTAHVTDESGNPQGKITMKTVRIRAEAMLEGHTASLASETHNPRVSMFDIALHLERALSRGTRVAQYYISECVRLGYLTDQQKDMPIGDTIQTLRQKLRKSKGVKAKPRLGMVSVKGGRLGTRPGAGK